MWRDHIQLYHFLKPVLGIFAALRPFFFIFLQISPRVQQYVWQGVIRTMILAIFFLNQTILFIEKFLREDLVLELEPSSFSTSYEVSWSVMNLFEEKPRLH